MSEIKQELRAGLANPAPWASKIVCRYDEAPSVKRYLSEGEDLILIAEVKRLRAALSSAAVAEREPVAWPRIMYVCEYCQEHNPEMCGHDRADLHVTPDGRWLCDGCLEEEHVPISECSSPPLLYPSPPTSELEAEIARLKGERDSLLNGHRILNVSCSRLQDRAEAAETRLAEALKAMEGAREVVDACAGDNRPARAWAVTVRDGIDAVLAARRVCEGGKADG